MNSPQEKPADTSHDEAEAPPATSPSRLRSALARIPLVTIAAVVFVLVGLALLAFSLSGGANRPLYPNLTTFTPLSGTPDYEPVVLDFAELNADPAAYAGRRLQVSGVYMPIEAPGCLDYTGPSIRWSLVSDELQLNAVGFENVLSLVSEGIELTVSGIWRVYQGPVGCGKEPADATVWYLAVDQILEPNPLLGADGLALTVVPGSPLATTSPEEAASTPGATMTPTLAGTEQITLTITIQATITPTATPTLATTPLLTPVGTVGTPGAGTGTPNAEGTPPLSPTPGPSPTPSATGGAGGTTTPGLPTTTPAGTGYPSPGTPTPTATPRVYP